jgi:hypothetical protein
MFCSTTENSSKTLLFDGSAAFSRSLFELFQAESQCPQALKRRKLLVLRYGSLYVNRIFRKLIRNRSKIRHFFSQAAALEHGLKLRRDACAQDKDVLSAFAVMKNFDRNELRAEILTLTAEQMTEYQTDFAFHLLKANMET